MSLVRVLTRPHVGMGRLGMYPGDLCYDPNRPSWLPYVVDSATEGLCWWGNDSAKQDVALAQAAEAAKIRAASGDSTNPDLALPGSDADVIRAAAAKTANQTLSCTGFQSLNKNTGQCEFDPSKTSFIVLAIGGIVALGLVVVLAKK